MRSESASSTTRTIWWALAFVVVGWLAVYNTLRIRGDYPSEAAAPALVGAGVGAVLFVVALIVVRRLRASGRVVFARSDDSPVPASGAREIWRITGFALIFAAAVAGITGVLILLDYLAIEGERPMSSVLLIVWNVVFAGWVGEEAVRVLRANADPTKVDASGFDSVWFGGLLTCVLAAVALSRDLLPPIHVVLIVIVGLASALVAVALWRHRGGHGVPYAAAVAVVVAVLSLFLHTL